MEMDRKSLRRQHGMKIPREQFDTLIDQMDEDDFTLDDQLGLIKRNLLPLRYRDSLPSAVQFRNGLLSDLEEIDHHFYWRVTHE